MRTVSSILNAIASLPEQDALWYVRWVRIKKMQTDKQYSSQAEPVFWVTIFVIASYAMATMPSALIIFLPGRSRILRSS